MRLVAQECVVFAHQFFQQIALLLAKYFRRERAAIGFAGRYQDAEYREAFAAMDRWVNDWIAFPGAAAVQWIRELYQANRLINRTLRMRDVLIDLGDITAPTLVVAAPGDAIVPASSSRALQYALGSSDITYRDVGGGHIGMVAGRQAGAELFPMLLDWLGTRSA